MVHNEGAVKRGRKKLSFSVNLVSVDPFSGPLFFEPQPSKNEGFFQELHFAVSGGENWVDEPPFNLMICKVDMCQP